jgi:hypothetical protein
MYSPKISEDLIPRIYRAAKEQKIPMTHWINRVVERALPEAAASEQAHLTGPTDLDCKSTSQLDDSGKSRSTEAGGL